MNNNEKVASGGSHTDDQQSTTMQIPMKEISSLVRSIYTFLAVENDSPLTASQISQGLREICSYKSKSERAQSEKRIAAQLVLYDDEIEDVLLQCEGSMEAMDIAQMFDEFLNGDIDGEVILHSDEEEKGEIIQKASFVQQNLQNEKRNAVQFQNFVEVSDFNSETPNSFLVGEAGSTAQHDETDEMNNTRVIIKAADDNDKGTSQMIIKEPGKDNKNDIQETKDQKLEQSSQKGKVEKEEKSPDKHKNADEEDLPPDEMSPPNLKPNMTLKSKNKEQKTQNEGSQVQTEQIEPKSLKSEDLSPSKTRQRPKSVGEEVIEHHKKAEELFETFFEKAFKKHNGNSMNQKRFLRAIERIRNKMELAEDEVQAFKKLFTDAKKDKDGRVSEEALKEAIFIKIREQAKQEDSNCGQNNPLITNNRGSLSNIGETLRSNPQKGFKKHGIAKSQQDLERIGEDVLGFFHTYEKSFYGFKGKYEDKAHLNLFELKEAMQDLEMMIRATEDQSCVEGQDLQIWQLLMSVIPRKDQFQGRHGTGLITLDELQRVIDQAAESRTLGYRSISGSALDESIDFETDQLVIQKAASVTSATSQNNSVNNNNNLNASESPTPINFNLGASLSNIAYRRALNENAKNIVDKFRANYGGESNENSDMERDQQQFLDGIEEQGGQKTIGQISEMFEVLLEQGSHEVLGNCPKSLQEIFEILSEKVKRAKVDFEELEEIKGQLKEVEMLRAHIQDLEMEKQHLMTFEQSYLETQDQVKDLERQMHEIERQKSSLEMLPSQLEELRAQQATLQLKLDEKNLQFKSVQEDLQVANREIERLREQPNTNLITLPDSEDSDDEVSSSGQDFSTEIGKNDDKTKASSFDQSSIAHDEEDSENSSDEQVLKKENESSEKVEESKHAEVNKKKNRLSYRKNQDFLLSCQQMEASEARQKLLELAQKATEEKSALSRKLEQTLEKQRLMKIRQKKQTDLIESLERKLQICDEAYEQKRLQMTEKEFEIEEMKMALDEYQSTNKNLSTELKQLKMSNQILERKLRAEKEMSNSNASFMSHAIGGISTRKDILSQSILNASTQDKGNTSIMDLQSGFNMPSARDIANRSMSLAVKPQERSIIKSSSSFYSRKVPILTQGKADISQSSEGDEVKKVVSFDETDSDSDDVEIVTEGEMKTHIKSKDHFYKNMLKDTVKQAGPMMTQFREGESEEYNSEVDGHSESSLDFDTPELNFDILNVREGKNVLHKPLLALVLKYGGLDADFDDKITFSKHLKNAKRKKRKELAEQDDIDLPDDIEEERKECEVSEKSDKVTLNDITRDYLTADQCFIFSDEIVIYHHKIVEALLVIIDQKVYLLFKESKYSIYAPFDLTELTSIVMSPSNPMSAAFKIKDSSKIGRSHIIFQNHNMGLMIRFIQELNAFWLNVDFTDTIAMTVDRKPVSFNFSEITMERQRQQNDGLVNCAAQGFLYRKKNDFMGMWNAMYGDENWARHFYVLTNVGILVFEDDNFTNPTRLIPLGKLGVKPIAQKVTKKPFCFKLLIGEAEEILLRAPDRPSFDTWMTQLRQLIEESKKKPQNFSLQKSGKV